MTKEDKGSDEAAKDARTITISFSRQYEFLRERIIEQAKNERMNVSKWICETLFKLFFAGQKPPEDEQRKEGEK